MGEGLPAASDASSSIPAWLTKQRERPASTATAPPAPSPFSPGVSGAPSKQPKAAAVAATILPASVGRYSFKNWLLQRFSRDSLIGFAGSLSMHLIVLGTMACILISRVAPGDSINLWGLIGESDEAGSDLLIDTGTSIDVGDSAALPMADTAQMPDLNQSPAVALDGALGGDAQDAIRFGSGGKGLGEGNGGGGDGVKMGAPSLKIPGHAKTKGSFSAWTDPRDPNPNQDYVIVIQIRLPTSVRKFRGSDITGLVEGTDRYRQVIRFKSTDQFPVEDGVVELRITVPGGALRVRDTIRIESKTLREKQTFEIEF